MTDIDVSPNNQSALAKLLCGNIIASGGEIYEVLSYLSTSIDNVVNGLNTLESMPPNQISLFSPFLGRSILELGCTALIARLDPFRVLMLREYQMQPNYDTGKRNNASISWTGDIFVAEDIKNPWSDNSLKSPTRALLGEYYKQLIWKTNFNKLLDATADIIEDEWIADLRIKDFYSFYGQTSNEIKKGYSAFSKGIHHESVIPLSEDIEIIQNIKKAIRNVSTLGLFVCVISHTLNKLDIETAIATYREIQEMGVLQWS